MRLEASMSSVSPARGRCLERVLPAVDMGGSLSAARAGPRSPVSRFRPLAPLPSKDGDDVRRGDAGPGRGSGAQTVCEEATRAAARPLLDRGLVGDVRPD